MVKKNIIIALLPMQCLNQLLEGRQMGSEPRSWPFVTLRRCCAADGLGGSQSGLI